MMLDYSKPPPGYEINGQWWRTASTKQSRWWGTLGLSGLECAWAHHKAHNDPPGVRVIGTGDRDQNFDGDRRFYLSHTGQAENAAAKAEARAAAWADHDRQPATEPTQ